MALDKLGLGSWGTRRIFMAVVDKCITIAQVRALASGNRRGCHRFRSVVEALK